MRKGLLVAFHRRGNLRYCTFSGKTNGQSKRGIGRDLNGNGDGRCVGQTAPTKARSNYMLNVVSATAVDFGTTCVDISTCRTIDVRAKYGTMYRFDNFVSKTNQLNILTLLVAPNNKCLLSSTQLNSTNQPPTRLNQLHLTVQ